MEWTNRQNISDVQLSNKNKRDNMQNLQKNNIYVFWSMPDRQTGKTMYLVDALMTDWQTDKMSHRVAPVQKKLCVETLRKETESQNLFVNAQ